MTGRAHPLVFITLGGLMLRAWFFSGYILSDDVFYLSRTLELASGQAQAPATHWAARLGLVGPAALAVAAFGPSKLTMVLWPFVCSALMPVVAYVVTARLFDRASATLAALLAACLPLDVIFASHLFAYAPRALLLGGAAYFWFSADDRGRARPFAAGALVGAACLVHEISTFVLVFPLFEGLVRRTS